MCWQAVCFLKGESLQDAGHHSVTSPLHVRERWCRSWTVASMEHDSCHMMAATIAETPAYLPEGTSYSLKTP